MIKTVLPSLIDKRLRAYQKHFRHWICRLSLLQRYMSRPTLDLSIDEAKK